MSELAPIAEVIVASGCFAAIDNIWVMLAIVVISAISSWLQNRNKKAEEPPPWGGEDDEAYQQQRSGSGSSAPPNPNQPLNWEEELKRLLEGKPPLDGTAGTPQPPPPPPPPIIRRTPPPVPEPISGETQEVESTASRESSSPWQERALDSLPEPSKPLVTLGDSAHSYKRATQLHESVAARMRQVGEQTEKHGKPLVAPAPLTGRPVSADAQKVTTLLRHPATARQVLLASFVLAPPKALEG